MHEMHEIHENPKGLQYKMGSNLEAPMMQEQTKCFYWLDFELRDDE